MNRITLPSFTRKEVTPSEMRQLVSALELRFQGVEDDVRDINTDDDTFYQPGITGSELTLDYSAGQYFFVDLNNAETTTTTVTISGTPANDEFGRMDILVLQHYTLSRNLLWDAGTVLWRDSVRHAVTTEAGGYTHFRLRSWGGNLWMATGDDYY